MSSLTDRCDYSCLNDQTQPGKGQFGVHRGAHEVTEAIFRAQRDLGGPLGGGGPLWPRLISAGDDNDRAVAVSTKHTPLRAIFADRLRVSTGPNARRGRGDVSGPHGSSLPF